MYFKEIYIYILVCSQVIELLDAFPNGLDFMMVFEYMPSGLWEILRDTDISLTLVQIKTYMKMLLEGIAYIHGKNIMHRVFRYYYSSIPMELKCMRWLLNCWNCILGFEARKFVDQWQGNLEDRRFWLKQIDVAGWYKALFTSSCHKMVSSTGITLWSTILYVRNRHVVDRLHIRWNAEYLPVISGINTFEILKLNN